MQPNMQKQKDIQELESLYEKRREEYQEALNIQNRLEATKEVNIKEINKDYAELDENILNMFGLELDKPIEEMNSMELESLRDKVEVAFTTLSSSLRNYLNTGETQHITPFTGQSKSEPTPIQSPQEQVVAEVVEKKYETDIAKALG